MKTIIVYASKYGAAGVAAQRIADKINGAAVHNLKNGNAKIADYDCVIIGGSIYAGMIRKEVKKFVTQNLEALIQKKIGLFISSMEAENGMKYIESNFSPEIRRIAKATCCVGGIFDPKKAGFLDRFIMKIVAKKLVYMDTLNNKKIEEFAEAMKK